MSIEELKGFFASINLPDQLQLDEATRIVNMPLFIEGHLLVAENNINNPAFSGFKMRLEQARESILNQPIH